MRAGTILVMLALLAACAPTQTSKMSQEAGKRLEAKPGDTVLSIVRERSLPSELIDGVGDLLGRRTMSGLTTLQYRGVENGKAVFKRRSVDMESAATDMKPFEVSKVHNQDDLNIFVNLAQPNKVVVVESRSLVIESADNYRLVYSIREASKPVQKKEEARAKAPEKRADKQAEKSIWDNSIWTLDTKSYPGRESDSRQLWSDNAESGL